MTSITRQDVIKIAQMSNIMVHETEIEPLVAQLQAVLSYASRVKEIAQGAQEWSPATSNVMREDVIIRTDAETILAQAPAREANYFVVPAIIEQK